MIKKVLTIIMIVCLLTGQIVLANTGQTADFLLSAVPEPGFGAVGGEWLVLGLARSEKDAYSEYFNAYYENLCEAVKNTNGVLHERKYTEYARVVLALASINKNPENVLGYDLTQPLYDFDKTVSQGINGAVYALLALDCITEDMTELKARYIDFILSKQLSDGGFSLGMSGEIDLTAMVLCALSEHIEHNGVKAAVENALSFISEKQESDGGFSMYGVKTSESSAQVLNALCALGIYDTDERFVKNGNTVGSNLMSFKTDNGGFLHTKEQTDANLMATEQAFYALVAKERFETGKPALFDMKISGEIDESNEKTEASNKNVIYPGKSFLDITGLKEQKQIEALAERGIISGMDERNFAPFNTMTRAEFATICVKTLGIEPVYADRFSDVSKDDWYYPYVASAFDFGIIKGVSEDEFNPNGTITLSEASVMVSRMAEKCGKNTNAGENEIMFVLSQFEDYTLVPDWAKTAFCYCYKTEILPDDAMEIKPHRAVLRAEIAGMLYELLNLVEK
ncbi:MAG: S-layer homology domain-containing protein [Clostridia bacterium]|nr:S-layer homology domain-containing protein [Clostridia bacterium]